MNQGDKMGGCAWVTLATNDSYSLGALVLAHSLKKSNTAHKLAVLITPAVSQPMREQLQTVFDVVKTVDVLDSKDEAHLALMKRPELGITFTKIHCWRLTEFEKCVFLDADTLVVRNCDELFEREEFSAAPDVSWPDCFNSGVFVYKPSIETFNKLLQFAMEKGSFDGGDQGLLNQFFSDWATEDIKKHLPFVYNLTSVAAYSYIPAFKQYGAETRIVHFIGTGKPWLQQLDPATRTITPTSGSEHLAPLLQQWWDLFCEKVHPNLSKNLENSNDGMSHPPVEACSNTHVALTSDEPQSPRLIEPCLQYREKDDYRQHNLPYQPFDVRGSSGELLNEEFLLASVVTSNDSGEQQRRDGEKLEEKDTKPEVQEERNDTEQTKPEFVEDKTEEKQEEPPAPKDPFDYNTFFPDEKCINNYLEQNVMTYQPFEAPTEDAQPANIPLPRFLTMPEDDQRQKGNIEVMEHQSAPEPPPPPPPPPPPLLPVSETTQEKPIEAQREPKPPPVEKHELLKSKSMTFIPVDVIATDVPSPPQRSIWKSQPNVNVDLNRKYSMPKLKPLLPRQNSKTIQTPIPRVTLYTEFLMSADYKDPVDLPKDKVGFVETELRRSKSEADLKGKFGPLPYTKSPEVEIPEPKKPPLRELDNDAYDLSRCKRQLGNKPRDHKKENITSKLITPSKDKKSTLIKKRKSKELSPGDGGKEKPLKRERREWRRHKKNENVDEILKRLWEFSKNYQHYFGVDAQNGTKERAVQSDFKHFRNFVKDQKETTQKGLLGIQDLMTETVNGTKVRNENIRFETDTAAVNGLDRTDDTNTRKKVITPNSEIKIQPEKCTRVEDSAPNLCKASIEKQSVRSLDQVECTSNANSDKPGTDCITLLENIPNGQNGQKTSADEIRTDKNSKIVENVELDKSTAKSNGVLIENNINQNGYTRQTDNVPAKNSIKCGKTTEIITQNGKNDDSVYETSDNGCVSPRKASMKFVTQPSTPENTKKDKKLTDLMNPLDLLSTTIIEQPEKKTEDSLCELGSEAPAKTTCLQTQAIEGSKLLEEEFGDVRDTITDTQANVKECSKQTKGEIDEIKTKEKVELLKIPITQPWSESLESRETPKLNGENKDDHLNTKVLVNMGGQEMESAVQSQTCSKRLIVMKDTQELSSTETKQRITPEVDNTPELSDVPVTEETVPQEISSSQASIEESAPKGMFTIGSPERSIEVNEEGSTQPNGDKISSLSLKKTEEVSQMSKVECSTSKPDEILCVPDFDTPRSSRILMPIPKPDTDLTPQAPIVIPRKARIQRKPYENGTKYRSPAVQKTIKTGNTKNCAGIAGAIAQLNLETGGQAADSGATSAAHQEYIRRQNWETGNMDYMGKDSFENIWSKICQTLEGEELDKATECTQSPTTISTEEKTKPEGGTGTEAPVSLSTILQKCPEFIETLPSEAVTGPMEDDEIIFSKPETRQKCLTNIKEEEENGSAVEGKSVKLSDILKPEEIPKPLAPIDGVVSAQQSFPITPTETHPDSISLKQSKPDAQPQAAPTTKDQKVTTAPVPSDLSKQVREQTKPGAEPQAPIGGTVTTQPDKPETEMKSPALSEKSECTTVAIRQPISIPGAPCEEQSKAPAKTLSQKIVEKKLQQKPETPAEAIPLPAPESPTQPECKTVAIPYSPMISAPAKEIQEPIPPSEVPTETTTSENSSKHEKQKKGVFSKLLEMVGVAPKTEELSKSTFYDVEGTPMEEESEAFEQKLDKKPQSTMEVVDEPKVQPPEIKETEKSQRVSIPEGADQMEVVKDGDQTSPDLSAVPDPVKPPVEGEKKTPSSGAGKKPGQAPMPKPARNASPKASKNKSPSPLTIPQTTPETALTVATPTPPPEPPKRRNSALLKVDESIPATPPVPEPQKESAEPVKSEVENIIEKAKTEVESILQDRRSTEKDVSESSDLINTLKLMIGADAQEVEPKADEVEELKVTSEEERQRHKGEVVSSKLSDQILKAIPPPRRKAISESKSEASGSSGAIPKTTSGEKPKQKPSSIPVPPPRNKGKPSTPTPPKGKTKK